MSDGPRGYSLPLSPHGGASIIPSPPWHYVGDFLVIEFWADPDAVAAVLPSRLTPFADDPGRCAALFVGHVLTPTVQSTTRHHRASGYESRAAAR